MEDALQTINECREIINSADDEIIMLLNKRFAACKKIGEAKKILNKAVTDTSREVELKTRLKQKEDFPGMTEAVYNAILAFSKSLQ